jgi:signal transduction histidine kinase
MEEAVLDKDGRARWLATDVLPVVAGGDVFGTVGISRDITGHRRADPTRPPERPVESGQATGGPVDARSAELEAANQVLRRMVEAQRKTGEKLRRAKKRAEAATRAKSHFLASMSHEIRTPLNVILGMTDLALSGTGTGVPPEGAVGRYLHLVREAGRYLTSIVNDILDLTKIESGRLSLEEVDFDLPALIEQACAFPRHGRLREGPAPAPGPGSGACPGGARRPRAPEAGARQLLANAVKFTKTGSVTVTASRQADGQGERLDVRVADTGIGIPEDKLSAIFESFRQADDAIGREYGGSGLGLTICRHLVERMGGAIAVESSPGRGSVFRFCLPLTPGDAARPRAAPGRAGPGQATRGRGRSRAHPHRGRPRAELRAGAHLSLGRGHAVSIAATARKLWIS